MNEPKGLQIGDILKWEATPLTRIKVTAPKGTKAGQLFVLDPSEQGTAVKGVFLECPIEVALTDEEDGQVVIQPLNAVLNGAVITEHAQLDASYLIAFTYRGVYIQHCEDLIQRCEAAKNNG